MRSTFGEVRDPFRQTGYFPSRRITCPSFVSSTSRDGRLWSWERRAIISSKKGSVRSNHYHVTDWHYMYVLKGSFDYYYRPTGSAEQPSVTRVKAGEMIFTPPMEDHATVFLDDTEMLVVSRNPRDQESYESDVRRVVLIDTAEVSAG